jgi:hypothetical protein
MDKFRESKQKFVKAAESFLIVQELRPQDRKFSEFAATTYIKAEEWVLAGGVYMKEKQFEQAAQVYLIPKNYSLAANAYLLASII